MNDEYYYALFYSFQANTQTGFGVNYSTYSTGGDFKDFFKAGALIGIGILINNALNR